MKHVEKIPWNMLPRLFLDFLKVGAFTFGGGYAMIAIIEDLFVEKRQWITHEEMMELAVVAESTPGPIAINLATYVGYRQAGLAGALTATLGMVLPSFAVILVISGFLDRFLEIRVVASAFRGIKIGVGILIVHAAVGMLRKMEKTPLSVSVTVCATGAMLASELLSIHLSSIVLLLTAAIVGMAVCLGKGGSRK